MAYLGATQDSLGIFVDGTSGTYTSDFIRTETHDYITGSIFSSIAGTLFIEQSPDVLAATPWDPTASGAVLNYTANNVSGGTLHAAIAVSANVSKPFVEQLILPHVRIRFVRTSLTGVPATFRLHGRTSDSGVKY